MAVPIVHIDHAKIHFPARRRGLLQRPTAWVKAVDDVTLTIDAGDVYGLVGESGCGKTTLVNGLVSLERLTSGSIEFEGHDLAALSRKAARRLRRDIQLVFQDPFWSLNPRWLVRDIVGEPLKVHTRVRGNEYQRSVLRALEKVGLGGSELFKYPHEFSGGVRQRIALARALSLEPKLLVLDEPTSAIDVLSQHQILKMLQELRELHGLTYVLVSHDLSVVRYLATRIGIMYLGRLVEWGSAASVFERPSHPYTQAMFRSVPELGVRGVDQLSALPGDVPSALEPPSGCYFHPRCAAAMDICRTEWPPDTDVMNGHHVLCWLYGQEETPTSAQGAKQPTIERQRGGEAGDLLGE